MKIAVKQRNAYNILLSNSIKRKTSFACNKALQEFSAFWLETELSGRIANLYNIEWKSRGF